jgi:hypothetical protein
MRLLVVKFYGKAAATTIMKDDKYRNGSSVEL